MPPPAGAAGTAPWLGVVLLLLLSELELWHPVTTKVTIVSKKRIVFISFANPCRTRAMAVSPGIRQHLRPYRPAALVFGEGNLRVSVTGHCKFHGAAQSTQEVFLRKNCVRKHGL